MAKLFEALKATQYCYFFDLQAGIILISLVGITVMITPIIINLGVDNPLRDRKIVTIQTCIILIYLAVGLISFIVLFVSANQEKKLLVIISLGLVSFIFVLWAGFLFLSYFESMYRYSCIYDRCPDLHWIMSARWRNAQFGGCERIGKWRSLEEPIILTPLYNNSTEISLDKYKTEQNLYNISNDITYRNHVDNFDKIPIESDNFSEYFVRDNFLKNANNVTLVTFENNMSVKQTEYLIFNESLKYSNYNIVQFYLKEQGADVGKLNFLIVSAVFALCWAAFMIYAIYTIFMYYLELKNTQQTAENGKENR